MRTCSAGSSRTWLSPALTAGESRLAVCCAADGGSDANVHRRLSCAFRNSIPLGVVILDDPFHDAAIPEAIIAGVMVVGLIGLLAGVWWLALVTTLFSAAGTILGLSIVLSSAA